MWLGRRPRTFLNSGRQIWHTNSSEHILDIQYTGMFKLGIWKHYLSRISSGSRKWHMGVKICSHRAIAKTKLFYQKFTKLTNTNSKLVLICFWLVSNWFYTRWNLMFGPIHTNIKIWNQSGVNSKPVGFNFTLCERIITCIRFVLVLLRTSG